MCPIPSETRAAAPATCAPALACSPLATLMCLAAAARYSIAPRIFSASRFCSPVPCARNWAIWSSRPIVSRTRARPRDCAWVASWIAVAFSSEPPELSTILSSAAPASRA